MDRYKFKFLKLWVLLYALALPIFLPNAGVSSERVSLMLDWFINPDHAPVIIAKQKGFFAELGLDVEIIEPKDPSKPPYLLAEQEVDIAVSYQPQLYFHISKGLPIVHLATLIETPLNTLVTLSDGPIKTLKDLKGKKIGSAFQDFENIVLVAMLKNVGLSLNDITLVKVNLSLTSALLTGEVDAIIGAYRNFELNQLELEGYPGRAFYPEEHGVPSYDELVFIVHKDKFKKPAYGLFVQAIEKAVNWLTNHPREALQIFVNYDRKLNTEISYRAWPDTIPRFAKRPSAIDPQRYDNLVKFMKNIDLIE